MAYNPYSAVNAIYKLKEEWTNADAVGDPYTKNSAAQKAQQYYNQLRENGHSDIADQLSASNYAQAKSINDKWAKLGKTSTRDYLYTLGQSRGMSQSDIDKLISWDNDTGEVSFGGKKIGTPDSVVDGVSYWSDTSVLDNAFNDYVDRAGVTRSKETAVNQENEKLFAKYNQEYEDLKNTNPFATETAKAILAKYDLAGLQGRDNAVASGGASNGGNIDSYAAANALRQQAALVNQGQMVVLDEYNQKLEHARNLLSDMGVNIDRVFNQDETVKTREFEQSETAKNNEVARLSEQASVTGYVPNEWSIKNDDIYNQFLNPDGTFKSEYNDVDIQALINQAKANGDTETAKKLSVVRTRKIFSNCGDYGKYANVGDISTMEPQKTETAKENEFNRDETAKNNAAEIEAIHSDITGTVSDAVIKAQNSNIWNVDGSLVNPNQDYWGQMVAVREIFDATTDENERARLWGQLRVLEMARNQQVDELRLQEGKTYAYQGGYKTATVQQAEMDDATVRESINAEERISNNTNATNLKMNENDNNTNLKMNENDNNTILKSSNSNSSGGSKSMTV